MYYFCDITSYIESALAFPTRSSTETTLTESVRCPNFMSTTSPGFTSYEAFTFLPFTLMNEESHASLATVRLFISRETFRNLSIRILQSILPAGDRQFRSKNPFQSVILLPFLCCPFFCCPLPCGNQKCDDQSCAFLMAYSAGKRMHGTHKACMISAKPGLSCRKFILQPVFSLLLRRLIFFFHMRHKAPFRRLCRSVRNTPKCRTAYLL